VTKAVYRSDFREKNTETVCSTGSMMVSLTPQSDVRTTRLLSASQLGLCG